MQCLNFDSKFGAGAVARSGLVYNVASTIAATFSGGIDGLGITPRLLRSHYTSAVLLTLRHLRAFVEDRLYGGDPDGGLGVAVSALEVVVDRRIELLGALDTPRWMRF